jgi:enoyl-CoA hydratase
MTPSLYRGKTKVVIFITFKITNNNDVWIGCLEVTEGGRMDNIILEACGDHIELITLNRPQYLNALNTEIIQELSECLNNLKADTRCLIITGAGNKAFCAGADIEQMVDLKPELAQEYSRYGIDFMNQLEQLSIPVIAAVNGYALGGGCELLLSCDLRIASSNAKFGLPEIKMGIIPGFGGMKRLARDIGMTRAKEIVFTNRMLNANQAMEYGLINTVVDPEQLLPTAFEMAKKISTFSKTAIGFAKSSVLRTMTTDQMSDYSFEIEAFGKCFGTEDQKQAMGDFIKRKNTK